MNRREQLSHRQLGILRDMLQNCDNNKIKVLHGVRGSGKLTLLRKLEDTLVANGVGQDQIIELDIECFRRDISNDSLLLKSQILERLGPKDRRYYVMLNQLTFINGWEQILYELLNQYQISFFMTSSYANWYSDTFRSLFGGNYLEYRFYPMSFSEYLETKDIVGMQSVESMFQQYLRYGSLTPLNSFLLDDHTAKVIANGMYNTILVNDLMHHNVIKDTPMFERLAQYMMRNIGVLGSPKSISDYFTLFGYKVASETISNYLTALENSYMFYKIPRYDILAQKELKNRGKYFIVDTGLRHALTNNYDDLGYELENTVLFELLRRGCQVQIGKIGKSEIDFVATKNSSTVYYQISRTISRQEDFYVREHLPLLRIKDPHAKKVILSMDQEFPEEDGIEFKNILEFLCEDSPDSRYFEKRP